MYNSTGVSDKACIERKDKWKHTRIGHVSLNEKTGPKDGNLSLGGDYLTDCALAAVKVNCVSNGNGKYQCE